MFDADFRTLRQGLALSLLFFACATSAAESNVYYRYVDENGIQVLDDEIPPRYAQKGYEVVSLSGDVIKVVEPAPDAEDLERQRAEERLRAQFRRLSRRYSSVEDIEAAKQRKLDNIDTNIAIVRGNITGVEAQIENLMAQAADVERAGRAVPESLLEQLTDSRAELAAAKDLLATRLKEHAETAARFEEDKENYIQGKKLSQ